MPGSVLILASHGQKPIVMRILKRYSSVLRHVVAGRTNSREPSGDFSGVTDLCSRPPDVGRLSVDFDDSSGRPIDDDDDGSVNDQDRIGSIREAVVIELNGLRNLIAHSIVSCGAGLSDLRLGAEHTARQRRNERAQYDCATLEIGRSHCPAQPKSASPIRARRRRGIGGSHQQSLSAGCCKPTLRQPWPEGPAKRRGDPMQWERCAESGRGLLQ